jgi:hypothetical protein
MAITMSIPTVTNTVTTTINTAQIASINVDTINQLLTINILYGTDSTNFVTIDSESITVPTAIFLTLMSNICTTGPLATNLHTVVLTYLQGANVTKYPFS